MLITSVFKYIFGPLITGFCSSSSQSNTSGAIVTADQLTGAHIDRLLTITENSTNLLHSLSKSFIAKQPSGVEILESSEKQMLPAVDAKAQEETTETDSKTLEETTQVIADIHETSNQLPCSSTSATSCVSETTTVSDLSASLSDFISVDINSIPSMNNSKDFSSDDDDIVILGRFDENDDLAEFDKFRL